MSKVQLSGRIKKFALHKFDSGIEQSLVHNGFIQDLNLKATLIQDNDIKIKENPFKLVNCTNRISHHKSSSSIQNLLKEWPEDMTIRSNQEKESSFRQVTLKSLNKIKQKDKNLIELAASSHQMSEKNITTDKKIDKLRNIKLKDKGQEKKRSLFFSSIMEKSPLKMQVVNVYSEKKNQSNYRKGKSRLFSSRGFNMMKMDPQDKIKKYNTHFIDMEISVRPGLFFQEGERRESSQKKQNYGYNIIEKAKEKKMNQLMNSKNIYYAQFKSPPKILTEEEKRQEWEKKLESFLKRKGKVKITLEELKEFREIVYKKRQQQHEIEQQCQKHQLEIATRQITCSTTKVKIDNFKTIKRQQVNIQNQKDYEQLLEGANQQLEIMKTERKIKNKKNLCVNFNEPQKQNEFDGLSNYSIKFLMDTYRKQ